MPEHPSKRQSERFNPREPSNPDVWSNNQYSSNQRGDEYLNLKAYLGSNANIPSSSFYNSNNLRSLNDRKESSQPEYEQERRRSQAHMQRVDKLSRGSMDKQKPVDPAQNRANQRTDYNQLFDNIMGGSNRPNREKNLGLLSKGFMPNKSKGSIGANMFRD